ncbi:MAG: phosphoenolpyruvate carboxykinase (ATP), partial [Patescibacteria group bacterium]
NLYVPIKVPGVAEEILDPSLSWDNKSLYYDSAKKLAKLFIENIKKFPGVYQSIINSGPKVNS